MREYVCVFVCVCVCVCVCLKLIYNHFYQNVYQKSVSFVFGYNNKLNAIVSVVESPVTFHWQMLAVLSSIPLRHYLRTHSQGHHTIYRLEERERGVERGIARLSSFERTREGHRQSDEHWNRFKDNVWETSERRSGAHTGFPERIDTILN